MKSLVLAEKPSVGKDIARVLNCKKSGNGYLEGNKYIVTWGLGHLVTLKNPEDYGKEYKEWNLDLLPIIPNKMDTKIIPQTKKQFFAVKSLLERKDINEIIIATDAGREGELVARWIINSTRNRLPIKRLWISSVTDKAIKDGFNNLKDGRQYENLYRAAVGRSEADWIVGINATRALTTKYNAQLSCGRVQTPTLNMIYEREEEIKRFNPEEYYKLELFIDGIKFNWRNKKSKDNREFSREKIEKIENKIKNNEVKIISKDSKTKKSYPPKLYDLTELQRDAYNIFNYSSKNTLRIMQTLYEREKALTYPRTDSRYLTEDIVPTLKDRLKTIKSANFKSYAGELLKQNIKGNKNFVDNSKVTDHHAIIPTEESIMVNNLTNEELNIYNMVVRRFLEVLYPPYEYEETTMVVEIAGEEFVSKFEKTITLGWKGINRDIESSEIKELKNLKVSNIKIVKDRTKPKAYLNEGTLLSAMENPKEFIKGISSDNKKILDEVGGIGTVATRADIIDKLFNTHLIETRGRDIITTSKGRQLLELVPEDLKSPELTAKWEKKLENIEKGKMKKEDFTNEAIAYTRKIIGEIKQSEEKYKHENLTTTKCPECGKLMLEVNNRNGKLYVCQDRECRGRVNIYKITNARCPVCKKKLKLRGEGDNQLFFCSCGHRENMEQFNERRGQGKGNMSKKEISNFMKKQNKKEDDNINNDLFNALKGLKLDK